MKSNVMNNHKLVAKTTYFHIIETFYQNKQNGHSSCYNVIVLEHMSSWYSFYIILDLLRKLYFEVQLVRIKNMLLIL